MARLFGTDGVRGTANLELTAEIALELSVAAAHVLGEAGAFGSRRAVALVGRDTRASGEFLEAAVVAGLASAGVNVVRLGVIPTPGVAHLVGHLDADLGVMLSASHNPMPDNGIKFFSRGGVKLDDDIEDAIEQRMAEVWLRPTGAGVGRVVEDRGAIEAYVAHLVASLGADASLEGLKVVVDCANGAASMTALAAFEAQGAEVIPLHAEPDGLNINDNCGSTHLVSLQEAVLRHRADLGIALDGDADRCLAVDHMGTVVDGDQILAVLALAMREEQTLHSDTVVATVMSNLGFLNAMRDAGIHVDQTKVGDRYVLEAMNANGFTLGGEQSGHVIMSEFATTGDGVLTALHVLERMAATRSGLRELASVVTRLPQVLVNVADVDKSRADDDAVLAAAVAEEEAALGDRGAARHRAVGARVAVEAETAERAEEVAEHLAGVVRTGSASIPSVNRGRFRTVRLSTAARRRTAGDGSNRPAFPQAVGKGKRVLVRQADARVLRRWTRATGSTSFWQGRSLDSGRRSGQPVAGVVVDNPDRSNRPHRRRSSSTSPVSSRPRSRPLDPGTGSNRPRGPDAVSDSPTPGREMRDSGLGRRA